MRFWTCFEYLLVVVVVVALVVIQPVVAADENSWPMYGKNLQHTFANPGSQVNPGNVATLQPAWTYATGDAVSASPATVDGVLYDGSWDGFFFALDAQTGALKWRIQLDCQASIVPLPEACGGPPAALGFGCFRSGALPDRGRNCHCFAGDHRRPRVFLGGQDAL
jgi:hypothetical protein